VVRTAGRDASSLLLGAGKGAGADLAWVDPTGVHLL
jgi:hypothetical protein